MNADARPDTGTTTGPGVHSAGTGDNDGTVETALHGEVAVITLNRPAKLNALSTGLETALLDALRSPLVRAGRAVLVTGGDRVFSAGADVGELREMTPEAITAYYRASGAVYEEFASLPQPTVAAIAGYCLGGGLELALAADIRVADESAVFALPEVGIGILPSSGGVTRLVRAVGPARTRDLVLRGRRMPVAEAHAWGLISEVAPVGGHFGRALEIANELAAQPPLAVSIAKQVIGAATDAPREAALLLEQLAYAALNRTA
ncbi:MULTISPECIES: enoyl-CoA hydratase-related protein [unclassified Streptomyces]|uniref:enoyl-CoA hydratase/isomerase family protein n=1 Tax=unclassified Streptomyces TaxID=2593676 RepID=UPI002E112658|nr:enoyl-CoA hydratase-related protein [Streptomyces sp. NBC_01197]WSS53248.1 enoyl-CoA hydratase-related protein [Streptomyces sp. NBC_01180]